MAATGPRHAAHARLTGLDVFLMAACAAAGFAATWQTGRIGFYPFDQSIVFDGAWRVASGQVPWRDFVLPNGLTPIVLQAAVFKLFGVSWTTYVVHSAAIGAIGSALAYLLLRMVHLPRYLGAALALVVAATLYAPAGTPYLETHAFFFCLAGLVIAYRAASLDRGFWSWTTAGACFVLAALAKQIPTVFLLPLPFVLALTAGEKRWRNLAFAAAGFAAAGAAAAGIGLIAGVDAGAFVHHYVTIPLVIGNGRVTNLLANVVTAVEETFNALTFTTWVLMVCIVLAPVRAVSGWIESRRGRAAGPGARDRARPATYLLAVWIAAATWMFSAVTFNAGEQSMALVPIAAGLAAASVVSAAGTRSLLERVVMVCIAAGAVTDAVSFHRSQNLPRRVHDMQVDAAGLSTWTALPGTPPTLADEGFVVWQVPASYTSAGRDFAALVERVRAMPDNVLLIGDEIILYGLTGKPSITPFLWFHPGLVWDRSADGWKEMNRRLGEHLERANVRKAIVPENISWWWWAPHTFEAVRSRLGPMEACEKVGSYRICEISH